MTPEDTVRLYIDLPTRSVRDGTVTRLLQRAEAAEARVAALTTALQQVVTAPLQVDCIRIARVALATADRPEGETPQEGNA